MQAVYTPVAQGFIPNSVLTKLLWPQAAKDKHKEQKREEWKLPEFSPEQMEQISKLKQVGMSSLLGLGEGTGAEGDSFWLLKVNI